MKTKGIGEEDKSSDELDEIYNLGRLSKRALIREVVLLRKTLRTLLDEKKVFSNEEDSVLERGLLGLLKFSRAVRFQIRFMRGS